MSLGRSIESTKTEQRSTRNTRTVRWPNLCRLTWIANADGVSEGDLVAAHFHEGLGDLIDKSRVDFSLVRAAHYTGDVSPHSNIVLFSYGHHLLETL